MAMKIYEGELVDQPPWSVVEEELDGVGKKCWCCQRWLTPDSFGANASKWDGKKSECQECTYRMRLAQKARQREKRVRQRNRTGNDKGAKSRLVALAKTGAETPRPSEQAAAARLAAWADGEDVYGEE